MRAFNEYVAGKAAAERSIRQAKALGSGLFIRTDGTATRLPPVSPIRMPAIGTRETIDRLGRNVTTGA